MALHVIGLPDQAHTLQVVHEGREKGRKLAQKREAEARHVNEAKALEALEAVSRPFPSASQLALFLLHSRKLELNERALYSLIAASPALRSHIKKKTPR